MPAGLACRRSIVVTDLALTRQDTLVAELCRLPCRRAVTRVARQACWQMFGRHSRRCLCVVAGSAFPWQYTCVTECWQVPLEHG